jgi:two-component system phosphate regulon sensor histidine kinase PhoR
MILSGLEWADRPYGLLIWAPAICAVFLAATGVQIQLKDRRVAAELFSQRSESDLLRSELRQQTQAIDSFADGLDIAILICDFKGSVVYANRRFREMFRFENPLGRSVLATTLSYDLEQLVLETVQSGDSKEKEVVFSPPEERVALAKAWIQQEQQRVFLSVFEVTNLRRLERVRRDFVANVSHELRTPMSIIRAYAETLMDEDPPDADTSRRYLPRIIEEVDRLSGITQDLLVLSASESSDVQKQICDIAEVFSSTVVQLFKKAEEKGLALEYHGPAHLPIEANLTQMSQIALNLIDNAINYTTFGRVDVHVERLDDGRVEVKVCDTGIGIASEHANRIFERFYRVDKGRSRSTGGTGLGLSIVKHIVEAHDGSVTLSSALNEGSEFRVLLPIGNAK